MKEPIEIIVTILLAMVVWAIIYVAVFGLSQSSTGNEPKPAVTCPHVSPKFQKTT